MTGKINFSSMLFDVTDNSTIYIPSHVSIANINTINTTTALTIFLPKNPRNGQLVFIKDASGTAGTYSLVIFAQDSLIDGVPYKSIFTAYGSLILSFSEKGWLSY